MAMTSQFPQPSVQIVTSKFIQTKSSPETQGLLHRYRMWLPDADTDTLTVIWQTFLYSEEKIRLCILFR